MQNFYPVFSYLLGSIPFGLILSQVFGRGNLRSTGSKNIGATNVFRTQGKVLGILTFLLDFLKGFFACYFFKTDNDILNLLVIAAPVVGHIFSIWLKFNGGKGIATYFGVLYALHPFVFFGTASIWALMFFTTKISAIAGIISAIASLIVFSYAGKSLCFDFINKLYILVVLVTLIIVKHNENIKLLIKRKG